MNKLLIGLLAVCFLISCKNKKLDSTKAYFSVIDYLNAETKKLDSLPVHFKKIVSTSVKSDTTSITKEEFKKHANEFLQIPDISDASKMDDYSEASDFDEILNNVLLIYTAKDPEEEVKNETIMMEPDEQGNSHVKTIIVTTGKTNNGLTTEKNMTWHIDKRFQIVTKTNQPGQVEKITTTVITWE